MTIKFIAEICSNHNQDLNRAIELIRQAKRIGCYGVKFQLFQLDKLFHPILLNHPDYQFVKDRKQWELNTDWLHKLYEECHYNHPKIKLGCTPFDIQSAFDLLPYVDFYKVSSYDVLRLDLIETIAKYNLPTIISTGMADWSEISNAVSTFTNSTHKPYDLTLLHCISEYPTKLQNAQLHNIGKLNLLTNQYIKTGLSDHSKNPNVIHRAISKWGANVIEFHLDLEDRLGWEYKLGHCWKPSEIERVIKDVNEGQLADGSKESYKVEEMREREFRASSVDGLRPLESVRAKLTVKNND